MSKMTDVLERVSSRKEAAVIRGPAMHDEIAKTYFHGHAKKGSKKKTKWKNYLPWAVAALSVLFALVIVLSRSSVDVKVRFFGEVPSIGASSAGSNPDKGVPLVNGGEPNRDMVKRAYFSGDARSFSMLKPDEIVLSNARQEGWANYTVELKEALDLTKLDIRYTARGSRGDEHLVVVIGDAANRVYRLEKDISSEVGKDWRTYTLNFRGVKKALDLSNIVLIKFEFGSLTAGNYPSAGLFLKDIYVTKTRRLKWL